MARSKPHRPVQDARPGDRRSAEGEGHATDRDRQGAGRHDRGRQGADGRGVPAPVLAGADGRQEGRQWHPPQPPCHCHPADARFRLSEAGGEGDDRAAPARQGSAADSGERRHRAADRLGGDGARGDQERRGRHGAGRGAVALAGDRAAGDRAALAQAGGGDAGDPADRPDLDGGVRDPDTRRLQPDLGGSVDFGIHYGLRYQEGIDRGGSHAAALAEASEGVGGALTLCAVGAAIAFYSFLPTDYIGLAELGLIAGTGMFVAFFANLTVLPALLTVLPVPAAGGRSRPSVFAPLTTALRSFVHRRSRAVCWGALGFGVAAALLLPKAAFDFDPINLRDPHTESVATFLDLKSDSRTRPHAITILADSLAAAQATAARLKPLPEVNKTLMLTDFVPADQPEKLDIIGTMALFLTPAFAAAGTAPEPSVIERLNMLAEVQGRLQALSGLAGARPESRAARELGSALAVLFRQVGDDGRRIQDLERRMLTALPGRLQALNAALSAGPVTLADLPAGFKEYYVAADGRARLIVYPKDDMQDHQALARFVAAVRGVAPAATGAPVVILEAGNAVVKAFWQAALLSVTLIAVVLMVILERWRDVALIFAPLVLAALLTVAVSALIGQPFNFANVIVLPLLFGLGVASGIHLVIREGEEQGANSALETSTPRAVVFSALTTIGSFGSIAISSHPGTASMGVLLAISITLTMACTLIVLPALIEVTGESPARTK
ncbi:MAG: MMPL family transporter [Rhodospirillales bacterium]|nr:MMPL family transporter [Rhodospirillales bacterium]